MKFMRSWTVKSASAIFQTLTFSGSNKAGLCVNRHIMLTWWYQHDDTKCISSASRAQVSDLEMEDCAVHWRMNKTHRAAKCDWQVINSQAKSCCCVNPKCGWLVCQVSVFPPLFQAVTSPPVKWIIRISLYVLAFKRKLISVYFFHL